MSPIYIVLLALLVLMIILKVLMQADKKKSKASPAIKPEDVEDVTDTTDSRAGVFPFYKKVVMHKGELKVFQYIRECVPENCMVLAKVRLWDIVDVPQKQEERMHYVGKIRSRHVDFLICDEVASPLLAVELDGKLHQSQERQEKDEYLNRALAAAGIDVLRVPGTLLDNREEIQRLVSERLASLI